MDKTNAPKAELLGLEPNTDHFLYSQTLPCRPHTVCRNQPQSKILRVYSRPGFTKVVCEHGMEQIKTLGIKSHEEVLLELGYIRKVPLDFVMKCSDDDLLACLIEFTKTDDDMKMFERRLGDDVHILGRLI